MSTTRPRRWWPAAISVGGVAAAVAVAEAVGVPGKDTVTVLVESVVGATLAGLAAAMLLLLLRRSRVAIQAAVAALAPIAAVAIGVTWATSDMFITEHDLRILWVVLVAAGAAGMAAALILAGRVADASRSVGDIARRLGEAGPVAVTRTGDGGLPRRADPIAAPQPRASWPRSKPSFDSPPAAWQKPSCRPRRSNATGGS